jgi:hypothetical protein
MLMITNPLSEDKIMPRHLHKPIEDIRQVEFPLPDTRIECGSVESNAFRFYVALITVAGLLNYDLCSMPFEAVKLISRHKELMGSDIAVCDLTGGELNETVTYKGQ